MCNLTAEFFPRLLSKLCTHHCGIELSASRQERCTSPDTRHKTTKGHKGGALDSVQSRHRTIVSHLAASRCVVDIIVLYTIISLSLQTHLGGILIHVVASWSLPLQHPHLARTRVRSLVFCFYLRGTSFQRYLARRHRIRFLASSFRYSRRIP